MSYVHLFLYKVFMVKSLDGVLYTKKFIILYLVSNNSLKIKKHDQRHLTFKVL